jgi:hypothetical protein
VTNTIEIAHIADDEIILVRQEDARLLRGMGALAIYGPFGPRPGVIRVRVVLCELGKVVALEPVRNTVPLACAGDSIGAVPSEARLDDGYEQDHAALLAYLLSAVRRKDWHAVSDAANDLRVLEASRG